MRAPGEASGMMALEIAMDELAEKLGIDPVELRILNDTQIVPDDPGRGSPTDPQSASGNQAPPKPAGRSFSTREFVQCMRTGAERFGWRARNAVPASRREGRWLIGMGMASAIRGAPIIPAGARVTLDDKGMVTVESNMTDMGTGSYTIIGQTAAEMMGIPLDRVIVKLADSDFPESVRRRWASWRGKCHRRCLCRLCEAARSGGDDAGFQVGRRGVRRWPGPVRQSPSGAVASGFGGSDHRRGQKWNMGTCPAGSSSRPSAPISVNWAWTRGRARFGCGACLPSVPPGASSIP